MHGCYVSISCFGFHVKLLVTVHHDQVWFLNKIMNKKLGSVSSTGRIGGSLQRRQKHLFLGNTLKVLTTLLLKRSVDKFCHLVLCSALMIFINYYYIESIHVKIFKPHLVYLGQQVFAFNILPHKHYHVNAYMYATS